ncbi:MAG: MFS transporter [Cytophagales bacterium]|nr:MFS transporter [Bernardetiaceae bacterium]MDW8204511.1 MFS transporter [Cytophagales bacterium]
MQKKNDPRTIRAWCMYDWANSAYMLVISSTLFPVYYNSVTRSAFNGDLVDFFGWHVSNTVLYSYSLSFAFLLAALFSPLLAGIADYGRLRKPMMRFFTYIGALACIGLYFFEGDNIGWGILCNVLACFGYTGSLVFYNAYLPEIARRDRLDSVSAQGFAYGYLGGVVLLLVNLAMVQKPEWFGILDKMHAVRLSLASVGIWWIVFSQYTFAYLPSSRSEAEPSAELLVQGYQKLRTVWQQLQHLQTTKYYLLAFFFYSMGVQTVMLLAATFGEKEIKMSADKLIITVLIIQLIAIPGGYLFARIAKNVSNRLSINIMLLLWLIVCVGAYVVNSALEFYVLAALVGLIMGGIQSVSRSTYTKLIPKDTPDNTSFFSFYDVVEKVSIIGGTFTFGLVEQLTRSMRNSALVLCVFFIVGLFFMLQVHIPRHRVLMKQILEGNR